MKRVLGLLPSLSLCLYSMATLADEGHLSATSPPQLSPQRSSSYVGATSSAQTPLALSKASGTAHARSNKPQGDVKRPAVTYSAKSSYFYLHDAAYALLQDRDGDGYHSEFRLRFDADTLLDHAWVYARLYWRRAGEREWVLYHVTDDFLIRGRDDNDDYFVRTTLDAGFATAEYDVLIDLYEVGQPGIVATLGPVESAGLNRLPLEEAGLDAPIEIAGYRIEGVTTTLVIDDDGDGHYSRFSITFNPDADFVGGIAYIRLWVRARGGEWFEEFVSEDFRVDVSGTADTYVVDIDWYEGYPTSFYDVQIDLYDAATDRLAASAGSERAALAQLPLEDERADRRPNPSVGIPGGSTSSSERGGGGSLTLLWLSALVMLWPVQRLQRIRRINVQ